MPITTRNVIIDDAEEPNSERAPQRPDYRQMVYDTQPHRRARSLRTTNPYILVFFGSIGLAFAAAVIYVVLRFINYVSDVNQTVSANDGFLLSILKWALTFGFVALIAICVCYVAIVVLQRATIRLQNGTPVTIFDLVLGWRNERAHAVALRTLDQHYTGLAEWARNSGLWSLNTLDLSTSQRLDRSAALALESAPELPPVLPQGLQGDTLMIEHLIKSGLIDRSGNSLLLGLSAGDKPHYIELDETGLIAIAGQPRVGKSSTAALLLAQLAMIPDSIVILCDKHGRKDQSLVKRIQPIAHRLARVAIEIDDIIKAIDYWHEIGSNRLMTDTDRQYPPCFLAIDEFTAMILLEMLPPATLHKIVSGAIEFPKVQTHGALIGHQWTGRLLGAMGAPTRRVTTQRIVHRIDPQDAEFLIPPAVAKQALSLSNGNALFMGASQPDVVEIRVPYLGPDDLEYLARVLPATQGGTFRAIGNDVAGVADVSGASESRATTTTNDDQTLPDPADAEDVSMSLWATDPRTRVAKDLLSKRSSSGKWQHSYREVQAVTQLRTATIVAIAASINRGNGKRGEYDTI